MRASEFVPTLRALESADDHKDPLRHQVRFCARWSLDNMCTLAFMAEGCVKEGLAETDTPLWARCCVCVCGGGTQSRARCVHAALEVRWGGRARTDARAAGPWPEPRFWTGPAAHAVHQRDAQHHRPDRLYQAVALGPRGAVPRLGRPVWGWAADGQRAGTGRRHATTRTRLRVCVVLWPSPLVRGTVLG
jgi:hypothetical protein